MILKLMSVRGAFSYVFMGKKLVILTNGFSLNFKVGAVESKISSTLPCICFFAQCPKIPAIQTLLTIIPIT